jgi:hypothetical protein
VVNANIIIRTDTEFHAKAGPTSTIAQLRFVDSEGCEIDLIWSIVSAEQVQDALDSVEQLEAVLDNLSSGLRLRQQVLENYDLRSAFGNGAGASVEADRG